MGYIDSIATRKSMLKLVNIPAEQLISLLVGVSFAAGLNVYATVATLGLLARGGLLPLPASLKLLDNWWVIAASALLFSIEFFADKVPAFDLIWNGLQTFVRIPVAALVAYGATAQFSPVNQLLASLLGGVVALIAHSGKTTLRAAVTPSPEPFTNITLSLGEDVLAVSLTWLATRHPYWAGGAVLLFVLVIACLIRRLARVLRSWLGRSRAASAAECGSDVTT
jgi:hypothetical protein